MSEPAERGKQGAAQARDPTQQRRPVQPFRVQRLSDLLPEAVLQTLQTGFAAQHGLPLAILEPDGDGFRYITPSDPQTNNAELCNLVRSAKGGQELCRACDAALARELIAEGPRAQPRWHTCHLGLADLAIPVVVAGKVVAVFFSGQQRMEETTEDVCERIHRLTEQVPELDAQVLCEAAKRLEPRSEAELAELARTLQAHAQHIANLGQDRYEVERRLRQELLLGQLTVEVARPCADMEELQARLGAVLEQVNDFFRLSYSVIFSQTFLRSPELAVVAAAGVDRAGRAARLQCPTRHTTEAHETNYAILTDPQEVREFITGFEARDAARFADAQAVICDFGTAQERASVTVFGPPLSGHTETLLGTGGDDFLERFHFEVGISMRAARLVLDLKQANEDKTQFLAQMTHEINAGLQTIVEESEWLEYYVTELAPIEDPEIHEPLRKISSEVLQLGARARSLLSHLRGGMPRREYKMKSHPLDRLIATCVEPFRGVAQSRNITIRVEDSIRKLPRVVFDWDMMKTAFMNLIDNAVKYSHFNRTIRIYGEADEQWASVSIEDFGLGIPPEEYERIFQPYVRGTQRDPRRFIWGSGLGLSVVKDNVETHGGHVEVKSVPTAKEPASDPAHAWENFITTFTVRLPLRQEE